MYGSEGLDGIWTLAKIGLFFIGLSVIGVVGFSGYLLFKLFN